MLNGLYMKLILKIYLDTLKWVVIKQLAAVGNMKKVGNKSRSMEMPKKTEARPIPSHVDHRLGQ